jgi:pimeloyl-ACP methyl ester carboxylesterase
MRTTTVRAGRHRIEVNVFGTGAPTVVIEPAFGGTAAEWGPIAAALAGDTTVVTYDRAAYGASSRAADRRTPADIAADLHAVLDEVGVTGPLVLVGFSAGGLYVRQYAALYPGRVAGMVLIESSHEGQTPLLNAVYSARARLTELLFVPRALCSSRGWRGGADRRSLLREWQAFRALTAADRPLAAGALGGRPLLVVTRADGGPFGGGQWRLWHRFHAEQARLSANSRHVVSGQASHTLHHSDPELVVGAIRAVLRSVRGGGPLRDPDLDSLARSGQQAPSLVHAPDEPPGTSS